MPIYEYKCDACGEHCELVQKFSDPRATECPHCHAHELKKQVTSAAFHLKGGGWYVTDFKGDNTAKKTDNKESADSPAKDSKKNEQSDKSD